MQEKIKDDLKEIPFEVLERLQEDGEANESEQDKNAKNSKTKKGDKKTEKKDKPKRANKNRSAGTYCPPQFIWLFILFCAHAYK
jgi:hypothetical protein